MVTLPFVGFAYRAPTLHVVLETANALVALLVGYLIYGRFRHSRRVQELLLVLALGTVAVANLVLTAVPAAVVLDQDSSLSRWAPLAVRLVGTLLLAAAALTPASRLVTGGARRLIVPLAAVVLTLTFASVVWGGQLPPLVDLSGGIGDTSRPRLETHRAVLAVQALSGVLYAIAAVAFTRQAGRTGDELMRWVGAGCVLAAFARVHYLLVPSLYTDYVYTGDVLRLGFYLMMLVGASREIRSYWELRTQAAVLEDRRRMARDLHDGLTQELTYIWSQSRHLAAHPADDLAVERIGGAAGRALDEARRAIAALTRPVNEPFVNILRQSAEELASRYEVPVVAHLDPAAAVTAEQREALLRITGEAVRNAVRHGAASRIVVALRAQPLCLSITDDGRGFDAGARADSRNGGFGITSMRERAQALGATLSIASTRGKGTTVQVTWT